MSLNVPQTFNPDFSAPLNAPLSVPLGAVDGSVDGWDTLPASASKMIREERSPWQPLLFVPPFIMAAISAVADGIPLLTDFAFILLTGLCTLFLITELRAFSFRWGIGGLLVHGGVLIWFCYDYCKIWLGASLTDPRKFDIISQETVARAGALHILFIIFMLLGLRIRLGGICERFLAKFPEPGTDRLYVVLIFGLFCFGMSPYFFFTAENPFVAIWKDIVGGRSSGAMWTVGRDGNVNYSFGAYLAQVLQVGSFASILGAFYAICVTRTVIGRIFGLTIWIPSALLGFGTGARGALVLVALPVVGFLFIRYQAEAAVRMRRVSGRAYVGLAVTLLAILVAVQVQITFRNAGFADAELDKVTVTDVQGNAMFSESLKGFEQIPKVTDPFYTRNPLEAIFRPIPEALYWAVVSPMPRAIWTTKPIDEVWRWYNYLVAGTRGNEGTTISNGAAGYWYFRYGIWGIIEGGLFMGFMIGVVERLLREYAPHKPILILVSLAISTWLFRCYRGLQWVEFHGTLVGLVSLGATILVLRPLFGGSSNYDSESRSAGS